MHCNPDSPTSGHSQENIPVIFMQYIMHLGCIKEGNHHIPLWEWLKGLAASLIFLIDDEPLVNVHFCR
jgi:hypothetical protein